MSRVLRRRWRRRGCRGDERRDPCPARLRLPSRCPRRPVLRTKADVGAPGRVRPDRGLPGLASGARRPAPHGGRRGNRDRARENAMLKTFADLSTPLVADACVRSEVPLRAAPPGIGAVVPGCRIAGRALPARHYGSVDVFLEAFSRAEPGDVLVIDNGGPTRLVSATWRSWRPRQQGWRAWWCGGCTATRRSWRRSAFRCSATAATRPARCGWTSGSPRRWPPRGSGRTW